MGFGNGNVFEMEGGKKANVEEIAAEGKYGRRLIHSMIVVSYKVPASIYGKLTLQNILQQHAPKR